MKPLDRTLCLFHLRWAGTRNCFARPTREKRFRWFSILVMGVLFLLGDYVFFLRIIRYLDGLPLKIGEELIVQLLNVVFLTLFAMVLFSSLISSLTVFYMSPELEFLHSLPVPRQSVLSERFALNAVLSSWMVALFSLPIFAAYGRYFKLSWGYYFYLAGGIFPFLAIPCVLGSLGIMVLMRYFPAKRTHQILSLLGIVFLAGLVVYLRFLSPEKFFGREVSDEAIMAFVESLRAPAYGFLPSSWITVGLTEWARAHYAESVFQLACLCLTAVTLVLIFLTVGKRVYFSSWCVAQEVKNAPLRKNGSGRWNDGSWDRVPLPAALRALLAKDFKVFFRDPSQWSQIFILLALVAVYIFNILNLPLHHLVLKNVVSVLNVGLAGFVLSALVSRFVFSSVSVEGRMMWTIYTAPVDMGTFLSGKFLMSFPPLLAVAEFLVIVSGYLLQADDYVMNASIVGTFLIALGLVGLGTGMGAMYPQFDFENVAEISSSSGGILFMILSMSFVGVVVMLGAWPMYVHFNEKFLFKPGGGIDVPVCYALIVVLSLAVAILPLRMGVRALRRMDI